MINNKKPPSSVKIFKKAANNVIESIKSSPHRKEPILMSYHHEGVIFLLFSMGFGAHLLKSR